MHYSFSVLFPPKKNIHFVLLSPCYTTHINRLPVWISFVTSLHWKCVYSMCLCQVFRFNRTLKMLVFFEILLYIKMLHRVSHRTTHTHSIIHLYTVHIPFEIKQGTLFLFLSPFLSFSIYYIGIVFPGDILWMKDMVATIERTIRSLVLPSRPHSMAVYRKIEMRMCANSACITHGVWYAWNRLASFTLPLRSAHSQHKRKKNKMHWRTDD